MIVELVSFFLFLFFFNTMRPNLKGTLMNHVIIIKVVPSLGYIKWWFREEYTFNLKVRIQLFHFFSLYTSVFEATYVRQLILRDNLLEFTTFRYQENS